ncbi:MAG: tRNA (guanosine(46)-N7)-methyltransferase TrmB [Bacteroidota bacterium]
MGQDKLKRFAEFAQMEHCFDFPYDLKGKWSSEVFKNNNPIVLELACGKGEYTVNLAQAHPQKNFIGIDLKSNRMWKGATIALQNKQTNVGFIRMVIEKLALIFDEHEVDEIWVTFPDPFPKDRHDKHRLTHPRFLEVYKRVLKPNSFINFKTDDDALFQYTLETLEQVNIKPNEVIMNVHEDAHSYDELRSIQTHYEKLFSAKGRTIKYCQFKVDTLKIPADMDVNLIK